MRVQRIGVIGAGSWGTALACLSARAGLETRLYARREELARDLRERRENSDYLPNIRIAKEIVIDHVLTDTLNADAVLYVQPAQHFRAFCEAANRHWRAGTALVICAKGIEIGSGRLLTEIAAELLPTAPVAVLSGPSFAREAASGLPTAVVLASIDTALSEALMQALSHGAFRPYGSTDPTGVEVAGATKNVLAIACGIVMGRKLGENARAALITRGLAEVARLSRALGGKTETLMGLAGLGDLILTCNSMTSRNTSLGFELGSGKSLAEILAGRRSVAEGVPTAEALDGLAKRLNVEMPISATVAAILAGRAEIDASIQALLSRPLKHEA